MLLLEDVRRIVTNELNPKIRDARKMCDKLRLHIEGTGLQEHLAKINNYENNLQYEARRKFAISNKFLTEQLLRPVDNAFNARGGSVNYKFSTEGKKEGFIERLKNVKNHSSLSDYVENVWFNNYITDPNGLIFMEIKNNGDNEETIEPCYKSIHTIRDYEQNGLFVDWVIFEPHKIELDPDAPKDDTKKKETFWAVDEQFYYKYEKSNGDIKLINAIPNSFEQIPAILCSNIIDNVTGWKKSPIDSQIELLDKYLTDNSVLSITQFFHNYPIFWEYIDVCGKCVGTGALSNGDTCSSCGGTGKGGRKDVTDKIELKIPDQEGVEITPPAGFIDSPIEPMKIQVELIDRTWDVIFFSHWGTSQEQGENSTATGRFIDIQPVNNRLDKYSKSIELAHRSLAEFMGNFYFPETFEKAFIQYGRRYLIETPDQIWDKYMKAKTDNAPVSTLDLLLSQYLESEFRENEQMFAYEVKKMRLEPFVHWDILTVQKLNVDESDYKRKLYFSEWFQTLEFKYVIDTYLNKLQTELTDYIKDKKLQSEKLLTNKIDDNGKQ